MIKLLLALTLLGVKNPIYKTDMIVADVNYESNLVIMENINGHKFKFYGVEDWMENDICTCIMDGRNTSNVTDDVILFTRYTGYIE